MTVANVFPRCVFVESKYYTVLIFTHVKHRQVKIARFYCSLNAIWEAFKRSRFIEKELVDSEYNKKKKTELILQRPNGLFYFH